MNKKENKDEFYEFELWRNEIAKKSDENCTRLEQLDNNNDTKEKELIKKIPKCLMHLTRKMCKCNKYCINESLKYSNTNFSCSKYDKKNLWYDDTYYDCDFLGKRVEKNKLLPINAYNSMMNMIKNINYGIKNLCKYNSDFENLLCEVYDLRDICRDMPRCMEFSIEQVPKKYCSNGLYENNMNVIERILGMNIRSDMLEEENSSIYGPLEILESTKNEEYDLNCIEKVYLNPNDIIIQFDIENMPHLIIKRDLSKFDIPDMNNLIEEYDSLDLEFKSIKSTDIEQNNFYSMISLSIISTLLFFILVFLGYKDNKNQKIVVPTIFMTLIMLFISIYSTLND